MIWNDLFSCPYMWFTCIAWFFTTTATRLIKKARVTLSSNLIATHSSNFSWDSLWQHVHTYIEFNNRNETRILTCIHMELITILDWFSGRLCPVWFTLVLPWQHSVDNQSMDNYAYLFLCWKTAHLWSAHLQTVNFVVLNLALTLWLSL